MQELRRGSSEKRDRRSFGGRQGDETDLNGFKKKKGFFFQEQAGYLPRFGVFGMREVCQKKSCCPWKTRGGGCQDVY